MWNKWINVRKKYIIACVLIILFICIFYNIFNPSVKINLNLGINDGQIPLIKFETVPGCSKTNFKISELFYDEIEYYNSEYNYFIASNILEYHEKIERYFEMDYFNEIKEEYFNNKILIVLIFNSLHSSIILKNSKIIIKDNKYFLKTRMNTNFKNFFKKCIYEKIFILEMEKI